MRIKNGSSVVVYREVPSRTVPYLPELVEHNRQPYTKRADLHALLAYAQAEKQYKRRLCGSLLPATIRHLASVFVEIER